MTDDATAAPRPLRPSQRLMVLMGKPVPPEPTELEQADFERWIAEGDAKVAARLASRRSWFGR